MPVSGYSVTAIEATALYGANAIGSSCYAFFLSHFKLGIRGESLITQEVPHQLEEDHPLINPREMAALIHELNSRVSYVVLQKERLSDWLVVLIAVDNERAAINGP